MKFPYFLTVVITVVVGICVYKGIPFSFVIEGSMQEISGRIRLETRAVEPFVPR